MVNVEDLSPYAKFGIVLILYTVSITYWAATLANAVNINSDHIELNKQFITEHVKSDYEISMQTIKLAENVLVTNKAIAKHDEILAQIVKEHAKCSAVMDLLIEKISELEGSKRKK